MTKTLRHIAVVGFYYDMADVKLKKEDFMKNNLTEIVAILERSRIGVIEGGFTNDTIKGFNNFIKEQKAIEGEAFLTTILFDDEYEVLHNRIDLKLVEPLAPVSNDRLIDCFLIRTALLDAIGKTINTINGNLSKIAEQGRPSKVIFLIITNSEENASVEFNNKKIKKMIEHQKSKYKWEFLFFGANINIAAVSVGGSMGIDHNFNYEAGEEGTQELYSLVNCKMSEMRRK
jgi:hypothetical protein